MNATAASFMDDHRHEARTCQKFIFKIARGSLGHDLYVVCFGAAFDARSSKICLVEGAHVLGEK